QRPWGASPLDFSPDGRLLAVADPDGRLLFYDLRARRDLPAWPRGPVIKAIRFEPRGERLAVFRSGSAVAQVCDPTTGAVLRELPHPREDIDRLVWRGDGQLLAAGCGSGRISIWNLRSPLPPKG